jgi:PKD repeat protein
MMLSSIAFAINIPQKLVISGQVINADYGNPLSNHTVRIESLGAGLERYYKEVKTDKEGYYYDTLYASTTKGSFKISTTNYTGRIKDTTVHYRFMSFTSFDVIIVNFKIKSPIHTDVLQAKFKYYTDDNGNRFKFRFLDLTEPENIVSWAWNFGDGKTSTEKNPTHIYNQAGVYKVLLTVTFNVNGIVNSNTISSLIYISESSFSHLGGHAFTEYFPVDKGLAYLYLINDEKQYVPVDTVSFDTLGFYLFYQIPEGDYVIKTQPAHNSDYYGQMLPTYYGDVMMWQDAKIIHHKNTSWEYDIHMMYGYDMQNGNGLLNGSVVYGDIANIITKNPTHKVDIYLFDNEDNLLISHYSNEQGFFDFTNIPNGKYSLYPEVTGIKCESVQIELNDEDPNATGIEVVIGPSGPDFIFDNNLESNIISKVFPNPANSIINVEFDLDENDIVIVEILDIQGRNVFSQQAENYVLNGKLSINISSLRKGTYILNLRSGSFSGRKLFVVNN